jgi:hypothetical protein
MHDGNETFQQLIALIADFLQRSLGRTADRLDDPVSAA